MKSALDAGADINQTNRQGLTPIQFACQGKPTPAQNKIISLLLDANADPNEGLNLLVKAKNYAGIKLCKAHGADLSKPVSSPQTSLLGTFVSSENDVSLAPTPRNIHDFSNDQLLFIARNLMYSYTLGVISEAFFKAMFKDYLCRNINMVDLIKSDSTLLAIWGSYLSTELVVNNTSYIADEFVRQGYTPTLLTNDSYDGGMYTFNKARCEYLYDKLLDTADGELKPVDNIKLVRFYGQEICRVLGESPDFLEDI